MSRALLAAALYFAAALCFATLASGADLLGAPLPGGMPAGNALAWLGLLGCSTAALLLSAGSRALRALAWLVVGISAAWLPASVVLAGNLALNFWGVFGSYWLAASAALLALVFASLLLATAFAIIRRLRGTGSA